MIRYMRGVEFGVMGREFARKDAGMRRLQATDAAYVGPPIGEHRAITATARLGARRA
jgi:hypothetical protein